MYTCVSCGSQVDAGYVCHSCGYEDAGMKEHLEEEEKARLIQQDSADSAEVEAEASGWIDEQRGREHEEE